MKKSLFLHIGQHKTGSSSIQEALLNNQDTLSQHNLSLFRQNPSGRNNKTGGMHRWINENKKPTNFDNVGSIIRPSELAKRMSNLPGNVIASAEGFFWVHSAHNIQAFKAALDLYFEQVHIIVYLRRQDGQIISHHQEEAKFNNEAFFGEDLHAMPAYQSHFDYYLDYNKKLSLWSDAFGRENMIIRLFDPDTLVNRDAVSDFFSLLNIDMPPTKRKNTSTGFQATKLNLLASSSNLNKYYRSLLIEQHNSADTLKFLPSQEQAKAFYEIYKDSNKKLNQTYAISDNEFLFNEDFSKYPPDSQDLWNEHSANQAILAVLNKINNLTLKELAYLLFKNKILKLKKLLFNRQA